MYASAANTTGVRERKAVEVLPTDLRFVLTSDMLCYSFALVESAVCHHAPAFPTHAPERTASRERLRCNARANRHLPGHCRFVPGSPSRVLGSPSADLSANPQAVAELPPPIVAAAPRSRACADATRLPLAGGPSWRSAMHTSSSRLLLST